MRADKTAVQIAEIANAAAADKSLIPGAVKSLNEYPHTARVEVLALVTALETALNLPESSQEDPGDLGKAMDRLTGRTPVNRF